MKRSTNRILTTHAGSLPRPNDLIELYRAGEAGPRLDARLAQAVHDVVREQAAAGIDIVNDGEFGKLIRAAVDFGAWGQSISERVSGFETRPAGITSAGGAGMVRTARTSRSRTISVSC